MSWFSRSNKKVKGTAATGSVGGGSDGGQAAESGSDPLEETPPEPSAPPEALADLFLMMEEHLNEVELEDISAIVTKLDQPPPLVDRISSGLDDPDELKEAILSSPTLSADVLRVVNSAAFALTSPISSIEHAVTYLGTNLVKGLVLQAAVSQIMQFDTDVQRAAYMRLWQSSYAASTVAQYYAQLLGYEFPSIYATRALLSNIGDLALISSHPELSAIYARKTDLFGRVTAQQNEVFANSAVLSSMLVRQWELPEEIYTALRFGLTPLRWDPQNSERSVEEQREDALLYLACRVGDEVAFGELRDVSSFNPLQQESPDFFFLPQYLRRCDLGALSDAFADAKAARRVQHTINSFGK